MTKKLYLTEYTRNDVNYGLHIFAESEAAAQALCIDGERVVGESTSGNEEAEYGFPIVQYFFNIDDAEEMIKPIAYLEFLAYLNTYMEVIKERLPEYAVMGNGSWFEAFMIMTSLDDQDNPLYGDSRERVITFLDAVTNALPERFIAI